MVSVISAISVLGITAGVMALVIALALSTGFKEDIQNKIVGATSHINLLHMDSTPLRSYEELQHKLDRVPGVTGSAAAIFNQVFISGPARSQGAELKGIDPVREGQISDFFSHIVEGDSLALERENAATDQAAQRDSIIVGKEMARLTGVHLGDFIRVLYPFGRLTPLGMSASEKTYRVAAIFESGLWDYDANWAYVSITSARRLFGLQQDSASVLQFKTDNLDDVESIADSIRAAAGPGYVTTTWIDLNKPLFSALKLEKLVLFLTISLIVFVAALNIVTTLIMMVLDKQRDIAILSAMGAPPKTVVRVFMLQGLTIGLAGTIFGSILGVGISWILNSYKLIKLQAEIYSIPYVPFHVRAGDVILISATSLLISFLATLYPARNASRLDPVEILRHE